MKLKNFFFAALAAFAFVSCEEANPNGGGTDPVTFEAGDYWVMSGEKVAVPVTGTSWWNVGNAVDGKGYKDNAFTFVAVEGGYNIRDAKGNYYYVGEYNGGASQKITAAESLEDGYGVWTVEEQEDGTYKIADVKWKVWLQFTTYGNFGVYAASQDGAVLPKLISAQGATDRPVLDVPASATVENTVTTYSIEVESNLDWTAAASAGVTLDKTSGNGDATVVMTFAANSGEEDVTYTVTFTAGELTKTFTLTHKAVASENPDDATVKTLTNAEICAAMTSSSTSYVEYTIASASGTWTVNASQYKDNTYLQCRGKNGAYIKTPLFDKDIKSVTIYFAAGKTLYSGNTYCVFPSTWTAPTEDAAYPKDGNVGEAITDDSASLTIPVAAGNKQVYISIIRANAYYLDHIDVAF